jgi:hypothetical protein
MWAIQRNTASDWTQDSIPQIEKRFRSAGIRRISDILYVSIPTPLRLADKLDSREDYNNHDFESIILSKLSHGSEKP